MKKRSGGVGVLAGQQYGLAERRGAPHQIEIELAGQCQQGPGLLGQGGEQVGVIRKQSLILNLPGQPKAIRETLEGLRDGEQVVVPGIFAAVPYCLDLIGAPWLETRDAVVKAFRPKSAVKPGA